MSGRDVVTGFYVDVLGKLVGRGAISLEDSVLVTCGGPLDERVMGLLGFREVVITNIDDGMSNNYQDAENLTYGDKSFDVVVVHAGLHHCQSPHRALLEMYRVARKCVVVFEARDSFLMRMAIRLGLTVDYELEGISVDSRGGVADGSVPNYIYRWTERDVEKTVASYDPAHVSEISFFYEMRLPLQRFERTGRPLLKLIGSVLEPLSRLATFLIPKQCNEFAFSIRKSDILQPWMVTETKMSVEYAAERRRLYR